ncbi:MAG: hypothetical protein HY298_07770 [Verrucomicrobia bacterium]|nr:hypothetical protein [Verrucomicrobiota bacterium]
MIKKTIGPLILILVIAAAAVWIYRSMSDRSTNFNLNPYYALGAGVAEETGKLLGNKGQVLIIAPDTSQFKNPAVDGQLKSFQDAMHKNKSISVAATVRFKLTPMEQMAAGGSVPRDFFLNALQSHPNVGAVVLFCGFPPLGLPDYDTLKQSGAKVVVASGYLPSYRKLLEGQLIHLAIVPRFDRTDAPAKEPKTLREWFDRDFVVITPDNTATLPY